MDSPRALPKGDKCSGCPFEHLSDYITLDRHVPGATITVLAQNPGEHEERGFRMLRRGRQDVEPVSPQPLIGPTGAYLREQFWPLTQLEPLQYYNTSNVIKCRPYGKNDLPTPGPSGEKGGPITKPMLKQAITHCMHAYPPIPEGTTTILAMGALALYALTEETAITSWRGWVLGKDWINGRLSRSTYGVTDYYQPGSADIDVFSTLHIASLFKQPLYGFTTEKDYHKFGRLIRREWPKPLPDILPYPPTEIPPVIGFDTEYNPATRELDMWSLATKDRRIYVVDGAATTGIAIPDGTVVFGQNIQVDIGHFEHVFTVDNIRLEDCMLAHSVLHPGEPHDLDYMTSVYGSYNRHKHLYHVPGKRALYAGLDADTTLNDVGRQLWAEFKRDPRAYIVYDTNRQPLLHAIRRFEQRGIRVDTERVQYVQGLLQAELAEIRQRACTLTDDPTFNIASNPQASHAIYEGTHHAKPAKRRPARSPRKAKPVTIPTGNDRTENTPQSLSDLIADISG